MRMLLLDEQIHVTDNNETVEKIIKDIAGTNVIVTYLLDYFVMIH